MNRFSEKFPRNFGLFRQKTRFFGVFEKKPENGPKTHRPDLLFSWALTGPRKGAFLAWGINQALLRGPGGPWGAARGLKKGSFSDRGQMGSIRSHKFSLTEEKFPKHIIWWLLDTTLPRANNGSVLTYYRTPEQKSP